MNRPIRVLEIRSVRGTGGGPEKTILAGAAQADLARYHVTVCYLRDARDDVFGIDARAAGTGVDYTEIVERHSFDVSVWTALRRLVRERQIDIVHAHDYKTDLLGWLLHRWHGVRVLATVHGWTGHSFKERRLYYPADKRLLTRLPRLVAVSTEIKQELVRCGGSPELISVVLNGIDHRAFCRDPQRETAARERWALGQDETVLGAVGRLEPQKRFDLLIDVFARMHAHSSRLRLMIAGDGSQRAALERMVSERGLASACRLVGQVQDIGTFHHALDLFIQSSDYEGTPNAVLEAMAFETPVVATNAGGTAELIADGVHGLIVPAGRPDELLAATEQALSDESAARQRAARARQRVERDLSFEARMRTVEAIYDEMMLRSGERVAA